MLHAIYHWPHEERPRQRLPAPRPRQQARRRGESHLKDIARLQRTVGGMRPDQPGIAFDVSATVVQAVRRFMRVVQASNGIECYDSGECPQRLMGSWLRLAHGWSSVVAESHASRNGSVWELSQCRATEKGESEEAGHTW